MFPRVMMGLTQSPSSLYWVQPVPQVHSWSNLVSTKVMVGIALSAPGSQWIQDRVLHGYIRSNQVSPGSKVHPPWFALGSSSVVHNGPILVSQCPIRPCLIYIRLTMGPSQSPHIRMSFVQSLPESHFVQSSKGSHWIQNNLPRVTIDQPRVPQSPIISNPFSSGSQWVQSSLLFSNNGSKQSSSESATPSLDYQGPQGGIKAQCLQDDKGPNVVSPSSTCVQQSLSKGHNRSTLESPW